MSREGVGRYPRYAAKRVYDAAMADAQVEFDAAIAAPFGDFKAAERIAVAIYNTAADDALDDFYRATGEQTE